MKKFLLFFLLLLLPALALAEGSVVNLAADPDAEWAFREGAPILEVVFPPIKGADACIVRMGDEVMLVDCATPGQHERVAAALKHMGITHVQRGFNTHPHDDHIGGFDLLPNAVKLDKLIITFPKDANRNMKRTVALMEDLGIPVESAADGDVFRVGGAELTVIIREKSWFTDNNRSAMLMVRYGSRSILLAADVELDAQSLLLETMPDGLKADILKYPHHGVTPAGWKFLKQVDAELAVITNSRYSTKTTRKDAEKRHLPLIFTGDGMVRLRTDGEIWVVDQIALDVE